MNEYNPLTNFWFWLAFWGFCFVAIFGYAFLRLVTPSDPPDEADDDPGFWQRVIDFRINNRPWYYVLAIWAVMFFAIIAASEAFVAKLQPIRPIHAMFIWSVGMSYIAALVFMRYGTGYVFPPRLLYKVNMGILMGMLGAFALMGFLGFRLSLKRTNDIAQQQLNQQAISPVIQRQLDSLYARATHTDSLLAESLRGTIKLDKKLDEVLDNTTPLPSKK